MQKIKLNKKLAEIVQRVMALWASPDEPRRSDTVQVIGNKRKEGANV